LQKRVLGTLSDAVGQLAFARHQQPEIGQPTQQQQQHRGNNGEFHRSKATSVIDPGRMALIH
jgi:hypothetical protein